MSSHDPGAPDAPDADDETTRRALEIHRRLMREHNLEFYHIPEKPASPPAPAPPPAEPRSDEPDAG
ncbi:MAG: hypothetical protein JWM27_4588 [Gemmatimonadetes bacterium]|nr:hypothetical protein [Gemmatimonadota bacterium]